MTRHQKQSGFTLIEMIVSLALFSIVVTISVGALLVLIASNERLQEEQSVMTNLSFALDSMSREIRTGTHYFCGSGNNRNVSINGHQIFRDGQDLSSMGEAHRDCYDGNPAGRLIHGIAFIEGGQSITGAPNTRIVYFFDESEGKLYRRVNGQDAQSIVSSGIYITNAEFYVTGSVPLSENNAELDQASVTIVIGARETNTGDENTYHIQTTVTQRTLDI